MFVPSCEVKDKGEIELWRFFDYEEFIEDVGEDHEVLSVFQVPDGMWNDGRLDPDFWEFMKVVEESSYEQAEAGYELGIQFDKINRACRGHFGSDRSFAQSMLYDEFEAMSPAFQCAVDWDLVWSRSLTVSYTEQNHYYFRSDW
jgi:hypothetical protein